MTEALFQIENLRVAYPQQRAANGAVEWAVDDVSIGLQAGERLGIVGESGCGKSTLGRAAMRLLPASTRIEGRVLFQGRSVFDFSPGELRRFRGEAVALVFQDPMTRLDPVMTIGEHCLETLQAHQPGLSRQQAKARAIATLEAVKIPASRWGQYPHEFSGGMRQRVAIALALLLNPKLIVADEPTTSLDVTVSAQILRELTRLCQERQMSLILISHDLAMVGEYCDRIAVMYQGKVVETGAAQTVLSQPQHEYTQSLLQSALHLQAGKQKAGIRDQELESEQGTPARTQPPTPNPQPPAPQSRPRFSLMELLGGAAFTGFEGGLVALALLSWLGTSLMPSFWLILAGITGVMIVAQNRRWIERVDLVIIAAATLAIVTFVAPLNQAIPPAITTMLGSKVIAILLVGVFVGLVAIVVAIVFRLIYNLLSRLL